MHVKFDESCLKQYKLKFDYKAVVSIYIVYEIRLWRFKQSLHFTLVNFLFVNLAGSVDFDKY